MKSLESWRVQLEKFLGNNFALPDAEDNTSGLLNRGGIVDLPLLRTLLTKLEEFQSSFFHGNATNYFIYSLNRLAFLKKPAYKLLFFNQLSAFFVPCIFKYVYLSSIDTL